MLNSVEQIPYPSEKVKRSKYMDENSSQDESKLLKQKIRLLNELLNNQHPISPYEGKNIDTELEWMINYYWISNCQTS